jgi:hypothetical protein
VERGVALPPQELMATIQSMAMKKVDFRLDTNAGLTGTPGKSF